jgi:hypothetical protein
LLFTRRLAFLTFFWQVDCFPSLFTVSCLNSPQHQESLGILQYHKAFS